MKKNSVIFDCVLLLLGLISLIYFIGLCTKIQFTSLLLLYPVFSLLVISYAIIELVQKKSLLARLTPWIKRTTILFIVLSVGLFIFMESLLLYQAYHSNTKDSDFVVVLGAKVNGTTPSRSLHYRLEAAIEYHTIHPNATIIVSGGQGAGEDNSEANIMKEYLINNGISEDKIITEDKSTSTYENLRNSKQIMDSLTSKSYDVTIITNGFHTYRSLYIASNIGLNAYTYSAREDSYSTVHYYIREFFGLIKEVITL